MQKGMVFFMSKKVGIICAGDREFEPFISHIDGAAIAERAMLKIYEGSINGVSVAALFSGVCKVNAAIAAQLLIDRYGVDIIINAGTAGAMDTRLSIFDTVISTETAYHDVADHILTGFHPWMESVYFKSDEELLHLSEIAVEKADKMNKVFWGRMVTGEAFIGNDGRAEINEKYSPLTIDMESASIAHVCFVNQIPFISVRCITDTAAQSGVDTFEKNCAKASEISKDITLALLEEINIHYSG